MLIHLKTHILCIKAASIGRSWHVAKTNFQTFTFRGLHIFLVAFLYTQQWTTAHPGNRFNFNSSLILQTELIAEVPKVISIDSETRY